MCLFKNCTIAFVVFIAARFSADLDENFIELVMVLRNFTIEAEYNFSGKVLVLPLHGKGPCKIVTGMMK